MLAFACLAPFIAPFWALAKLIQRKPEVVSQFVAAFFMFALVVGLPTLLFTIFLTSGDSVWTIPVFATAVASLIYCLTHPKVI